MYFGIAMYFKSYKPYFQIFFFIGIHFNFKKIGVMAPFNNNIKKDYKILIAWLSDSIRKKDLEELKFLLEVPGIHFLVVFFDYDLKQRKVLGV